MKTLLTFLIITFSFTIQAKDNDVKKEFEASFGKSGAKNLNKSVSDFDLFLASNYGDLKSTERFKRYLNELIAGKVVKWEMMTISGSELDSPILVEYNYENEGEVKNDSPLYGQKIHIVPDTVYREGNTVNSIYSKPLQMTRSSELPEDEYLESNIALLAADEKNGFTKLYGNEQFEHALHQIKDESKLITQYMKAKLQNNNLFAHEVGALILKLGMEDEYFAKRILIWEMNK